MWMPIVADIHFHYKRAPVAENGADCLHKSIEIWR